MHLVAAKFVPRILTADQKYPAVSGENKMAVIHHPPYSPDLIPCDFFLFPKIKLKLKGHRFDIIEEIQDESLDTCTTCSQLT
jgi:hypothetical protein